MKKFILLVSILALTLGLFATEVVIGTGTETQTFPLGEFNSYERSAALYLASEIGPQNSSFSAISWYSDAATSRNVPTKIYLKSTTDNTLTNDTWANIISGASLVYDQVYSVLVAGSWNLFELDTAFDLDQDLNLMILVERNDGSMGGNYFGGEIYSTTSSGQHLTWDQMMGSPPTGTGDASDLRPNVTLTYTTYSYEVAPSPAALDSPDDGVIGVSVDSTLNWIAPEGALATGYKLFLGTDNPPTNIENNTDLGDVLSYDPNGLAHSTTHYWQIVPYNTYGESTDCPIWSFTTETSPNPANIASPEGGASNVLINSTLNWIASDGTAPTGYKLFFGTDNPPTNIENNTDLGDVLSYDPNGLAYSTTHYWQVVPYNAYGSAAGCPIWSFTTIGPPLRGEKTIDPAGSGPDNFTSFTEAITMLNAAGVGQDGVVFNVPAGITLNEAAVMPAITVTGTADNPITFVKSGTGANPVVTVPGTAGATDYVFKLTGVDYVTFDGIDVNNAVGEINVEYGYWLTDNGVNGGSSHNIIKNCTVTLDRGNSNSIGVYSLATISRNNSNRFQNITVSDAYNGILVIGMSSFADENNIVEGCTFYDIAASNMKLDYQTNMDIFNNLVNYPSTGILSNHIHGLNCYELSNSSVYNNTFSGGNIDQMLYNMFFNVPAQIEIHHNTISGTVTTSTWWQGIYVNLASWGTVNIHHNEIHDIQAGMFASMIYTYRGYNLNINDNHIHNITVDSMFRGLHIIENRDLESPANIYNNKVHNIELTGQSMEMMAGINVQDRFANVYNNMVYDLRAPESNAANGDGSPQIAGISLKDMQPAQAERAYVYNNTVLLDAVGIQENASSACFYTTFPGPVDLKNNIFVNNSTPGANGKAAAFWKSAETFDNFVATMDKNIYYAGTPDARHLIYSDLTQSAQTLAEYKALNVGKDQNSYTEDVPFVSSVAPYDLHIDPTVPTYVESNGIYLPTVLIDDIDGDIRSITPDIGADEGDFTPREDEITLAAPGNVTITISGANVEISWDAVAGATGYYVYGSDEPYAATPWGAPLITVNAPDTSTVLSPSSQFKFYYVSAFE